MPINSVCQRNKMGYFEYRTNHYRSEKLTQERLKKIASSQHCKSPKKINTLVTLYLSSAIILHLLRIAGTPTFRHISSSSPCDNYRKSQKNNNDKQETALNIIGSMQSSIPPVIEDNTFFNAMKNTVCFVSYGMSEINNQLKNIDLLKFPTASAEVIKHRTWPSSTSPSYHNDVIIKKIEHPCVDERNDLSIAMVLRKIGETLSNPVVEMARESQIVYFYNKHGRCPQENETQNLLLTSQRIDAIISCISNFAPEFITMNITQNLLGPLLVFFADTLDEIEIQNQRMADFDEQVLFITKAIIDTSPRDSHGKLTEEHLKIPNNLYLKKNKYYIKIDNQELEVMLIDNIYFVHKEKTAYPVNYRNGAWYFLGKEKRTSDTEVQNNRWHSDGKDNLFDLDNEDIDILCGTRKKRGAELTKICSIQTTAAEERRYSEISSAYSQGSTGIVYDLGDEHVIKKYQTKIDVKHTSRLKYAINTVKAFHRIYGPGSARVSITPEPDGYGTATVYVKMLKIPGTPLNEIHKITDIEILFNLSADLQSKAAINKLLSRLQSAGVKHNDINMANILYDKKIGFNIIDFDSATFLPHGDPIPDNAMLEMRRKTQHAFNEAYRAIQYNTDIEKMLIASHGNKIKIGSTKNSIIYRIGEFKIKEFSETGDTLKLINHEIGSCNHVMKLYNKKYLKVIKHKNAVIYNHLEGTKPTENEVKSVIADLFKYNIIFANAHTDNFIKTSDGEVIPIDFNMIFSKNRIDRLHSRLKKDIVINYVNHGYRYIPHQIKSTYSTLIKRVNNSLGEKKPTRHMPISALIRSGLRSAKNSKISYSNTL